MASELIVQTLKGPTSGANANKVIVPAGQTLDMSAGGFSMPTGSYYLNQVGGNEKDGSTITYSVSHNGLAWQSAVSDCDVAMTPKNANSIFMISISCAWYSASNLIALSLGVEINGSRATPITGYDALTHDYNGHRMEVAGGQKHDSLTVFGIYNAISSAQHTFKILPYIYNEGSSTDLKISEHGTQMYIMEYAQ